MTLTYNFIDYINFIKKHFDGKYDKIKCNNEYLNQQLNDTNNKTNNKDCVEIDVGKNINFIIDLNYPNINDYKNIQILYTEQNIKIECYVNNSCNDIIIKYKNTCKIHLSTRNNNFIDLCCNIIENKEDRGKGIGSECMQILLKFLKNAGYVKLEGTLRDINNKGRIFNFCENINFHKCIDSHFLNENIGLIFCDKFKKINNILEKYEISTENHNIISDRKRIVKFYIKNGFSVNNDKIEFIFCNKFKKTNNILKKYKTNAKEINISNKNIEGILDLQVFEELEELYCSNNKITKIINISHNLKYINCSKNDIVELDEISNNLTGINCKSNPLKKLCYSLNVKPKKYPSNLTHLIFGEYFNQEVNNLPKSLTHLTIKSYFNQKVDNLPKSLTYLVLGGDFNQKVDNLPESLIYLTFGFKFNQEVNYLPKNLTHLTFGNNFNQLVNNLPTSLTHLIFGERFNQPIDNLPNSVTHLEFQHNMFLLSNFNRPLDNLPNSLTNLILPNSLSHELKYFPKSLKYISIGGSYNYSYHNLPDTIEEIFFRNNFYDDSDYDGTYSNIIYKPLEKLPNNIKRIMIGNFDVIEKNEKNNLLEKFNAYLLEKRNYVLSKKIYRNKHDEYIDMAYGYNNFNNFDDFNDILI